MKLEWMYSSLQRRLVRLLWRTFSTGKWRVNVFIISEKIGHSGERFRLWNEEYSSFQRRLVTLENVFDRKMKSIHQFREDWLGYSGERFQSGNEEWMYSSFQGRLVTLENVFDREMKSECIHHFREDWSLWRTFSIGKWRVFIISEKIGYSGERFRLGNEEWMYSKPRVSEKISLQRRLVILENVFDQGMKGECIHHFRDDRLGYSGERFRSGNEEWMYSNILLTC